MSKWKEARNGLRKQAAAVTDTVGEKAARAVRRDAVVAGRQLSAELRDLSPLFVRAGAGSLLAGHGLRLLSTAATDALARRLPRWVAESLIGGGALVAGLALAHAAWRQRPLEVLPRTHAALTHDIDSRPPSPQ
jgi:hypothetical protein